MVRVLVTGVNGLIGGATALALRRAGHTVYGLIRDEKQKAALLENEIIPVIGDGSDLKSFSSVLNKVSVVIDNLLVYAEEFGTTNRNLFNALAATAKNGSKKRYIYTSGVLVYNYPGEVVDETHATNGNKNRSGLEQTLIKAGNDAIETVIVRPGWVYGGNGGYIADLWFKQADKKEIEFYGSTEKSWGWVHVNDLADAYVRVVEGASGVVSGEIFDVTDSTRITCHDARIAFAKAAKLEGKVVLKPAGTTDWDKMMEFNAVPKSDKIKRQLGWNPKLGPLTDGLDLYYQSWKAHQDKKNPPQEKKEERRPSKSKK